MATGGQASGGAQDQGGMQNPGAIQDLGAVQSPMTATTNITVRDEPAKNNNDNNNAYDNMRRRVNDRIDQVNQSVQQNDTNRNNKFFNRNNRNSNKGNASDNSPRNLGNSAPNNGQGHSQNFFGRRSKSGFNNLGYRGENNSRGVASSQESRNAESLSGRLKKKRAEQNKNKTAEGIKKGINTYMPGKGDAIEKALDTEKGQKYIDAYEKGDSAAAGIKNVIVEIEKEQAKKRAIFFLVLHLLPIIVIILLVLVIVILFKDADTQIYSNENGGTVESEDYKYEDAGTNIFATYPGLYEEISAAVKKTSNTYKLEVDQYIILATLLAPIDNGIIYPIKSSEITDGKSCGEPLCYKYDGEYVTWEKFVDSMGDQAELLSKMQILTYTNKGKCGSEKTMEQYANNDDEVEELQWWEWLNPLRWFTGYNDRKKAEKNYVCTDAPQKDNRLPENVYTLSLDEGKYIAYAKKDGSVEYEKDPNSGGVFYWNLVNRDGFLFTYLKDYLYDKDTNTEDEDKLYEQSLPKILSTAEYIYSYYLSIRKSCDYPDDVHKIIDSEIENIRVYNPPEKQSRFGLPEHIEIDFEDQYLGGVLLAEYNSGNDEALKAFAILARTEAIANVGLDGRGEIENSSNRQNYNPEYSKEKYPRLAAAVEATRGIVITDYQSDKIWHTEYDAFCPVKNTLDDGKWYYLPEGQQSLPIDVQAYKAKTGKEFIDPNSRYLYCPCFRNNDSRPHDEIINRKNIRYAPDWTTEPSWAGGDPAQTTPSKSSEYPCWKTETYTREKYDEATQQYVTEYGWSYHVYGGHGRGASQYGLTYFGAMGYDQDALIRLFFPTAQLRVLRSSLPIGKCKKVDSLDKDKSNDNTPTGSGNSDFDGNGFTDVIGGSPLNTTLKQALAAKGYTIEDLNKCIGDKVNSAGYGTRAGVVAAGVGLMQCTMDMTGGYTYPYDHSGGKIGQADLNGKLGVNSRWGEVGGTCDTCAPPVRLGLNCANFVRWSFCNGGMNMCSQGSAGARSMTGAFTNTNYYPGAVRIQTSGTFKVMSNSAETSISTKDEAIAAIKPGDVLYSDNNGDGQHAMLIVGKDDSSITIGENGRKTRKISFNELKNGSKTYVVVLLDGYYSNSSNVNGLSW